jgi:hypothetical protein
MRVTLNLKLPDGQLPWEEAAERESSSGLLGRLTHMDRVMDELESH